MLACLFDAREKVAVRNVPIPTIRRGEVLVRLQAGGICGTDLEKVHGGFGPGGVLGHEVSGVIERVAEGVETLQPGVRVIAHHHVPCYSCYYCQKGDHTMCDSFKATNLDPCGFAEYFRVPEYNVVRGAVVPIPDAVSYEEATMIEPTACCLRALNRAKISPSDTFLIVGLGPAGLTHLQLLRLMGASVIIGSDVQKCRTEMAKKMGADLALNPADNDVVKEVKKRTGLGADVAIVATGNPKALVQAFSSVRKGGKVLLFGAPAHGASFNLDISSLFGQQVSLVTSYSCVESEIQTALKMVTRGQVHLAAMITHRFSLKDADKALMLAGSGQDVVKTMIVE